MKRLMIFVLLLCMATGCTDDRPKAENSFVEVVKIVNMRTGASNDLEKLYLNRDRIVGLTPYTDFWLVYTTTEKTGTIIITVASGNHLVESMGLDAPVRTP